MVRLTLPTVATLPGASVPLVLHVRNAGTPIVIDRTIQVLATSPSGTTFRANWGFEELGGFETLDDGPLVVGTGAAAEIVIPARALTQPSWALDSRIVSEPGEWTLQVALLGAGQLEAGRIAVSGPAKLLIQTPNDADAVVLRAIQARKWSQALAAVYPERRDSKYFPYLAPRLAHQDPLHQVTVLSAALSQHPDSPVATDLRFAIANYYRVAATETFHEAGDLDKALQYIDKARAELQRVTQADAWAAEKARQRMADLPTRAIFEESRRMLVKANRRNQ
jgi:hypothetical protein